MLRKRKAAAARLEQAPGLVAENEKLMAVSKGQRNSKIAIEGGDDSALISYISRYSPELWEAMRELGGGGELSINPRGWVTLHPPEGKPFRRSDREVRWICQAARLISLFPEPKVNLPCRAERVSVVLAAGRGTRMGAARLPKVCYPVGSRSAIRRALLTYERCGIDHHLVVVGVMGEKVVQELAGNFPSVTFVCQGQRLGTGHAAKQAAYLLQREGFKGRILVVAGDKVLSQHAIERLERELEAADADLAVLAADESVWPDAGRLMLGEDGQPKCIIEKLDIAKSVLWERIAARARAAGTISAQEVRRMIRSEVADEEKAGVLLRRKLGQALQKKPALSPGEVVRIVEEDGLYFTIPETPGKETRLTGAELEARAELRNASVYMFKAEAFYRAVAALGRANAQNEMYLTDAVKFLAASRSPRYRIVAVLLDRPEDAMTFNTSGELREIEKHISSATVEWLAARGVRVEGNPEYVWVDDLDSSAKVGRHTVISSPAFIDLGEDPRMTIGHDCQLSGRILSSRVGNRCVIDNAELQNVVVGDGSVVRGSRLVATSLEVIPPGSRVVGDDWSQVELERDKQKRELARLRRKYQQAVKRGSLAGSAADYLGDVNETNVYVDPRISAKAVVRGMKLTPGDIALPGSRRTVRHWLEDLENSRSAMVDWLLKTYGDHEETMASRKQRLKEVLHGFGRIFGYQREVLISRAPGRLNLMGRHIDRQGGYNNQMAIDKEVLVVAESRPDDQVVLHNLDRARFPRVNFRVLEELTKARWQEWTTGLGRWHPGETVPGLRQNWDSYVKAAVVRLPEQLRVRPLRGMNLVASGDIPIAAGLSASSAMIAAAAEALVHINYLAVTSRQLIDLCGEADWYTGADAYSGSHAAVKLGRRGSVAQIRFFDLEVERNVPFPKGYSIVICHRGFPPPDADRLEQNYRASTASSEIALLLLQQAYPEMRTKLRLLRDLYEKHLGIDTSRIYQMIKSLPEVISRLDLRQMVSDEHHDRLEELFASHAEPEGGYRLRDVCLFAVGECARSELYPGLLKARRMRAVGELMRISHDGDRVVHFDADGSKVPWRLRATDESLDRLIADAQSRGPRRRDAASLWRQPGGYGSSSEELDQLVDLALRVKGVLGAQLAGAAAGGVVMILVRRTALARLKQHLTENYYLPRGISPQIEECIPVEGAGVIEY